MEVILISGNPIDGLKFHGPFRYTQDAFRYAEDNNFDGDWWVSQFEPKEEDK